MDRNNPCPPRYKKQGSPLTSTGYLKWNRKKEALERLSERHFSCCPPIDGLGLLGHDSIVRGPR